MGESTPLQETDGLARSPAFTTTHWSVVLTAAGTDSPQASQALERLCRVYWYPLYAYTRRRGYDRHEAQDLTQAFFERMLEKHFLDAVDPSKGKFRSFLLVALEHFLAKEWRRAHAQKRGGRAKFLSLDEESGEQQYLETASAALTPEQLFEQQWAIVLLDQVLIKLRDEFIASGKGESFTELKVFLTGEKRAGSYAELAVKLHTTEAALKMAVSRMRRRYGELLRAELVEGVAKTEQVEEELRLLQAALSL